MKKMIVAALLAFLPSLYAADIQLRNVMREQDQVQWALKKVVSRQYNLPFTIFAMGSPKAMHISCEPEPSRANMCAVSFLGMTGELTQSQSQVFEFERAGRHVGFFTPGRTYDLHPAGSQAFVLSRLKTLQDAR